VGLHENPIVCSTVVSAMACLHLLRSEIRLVKRFGADSLMHRSDAQFLLSSVRFYFYCATFTVLMLLQCTGMFLVRVKPALVRDLRSAPFVKT